MLLDVGSGFKTGWFRTSLILSLCITISMLFDAGFTSCMNRLFDKQCNKICTDRFYDSYTKLDTLFHLGLFETAIVN
jgi:hypothetical protein